MSKLLIFSLLLLGCTKQPRTIEISNPASDQGKYPRLFTDNSGILFMSWYEDLSDTTKLYYSSFVEDSWSEPQLISKSDSWFVNWADFPSIIGFNGKPLAAHWLQKTAGGTYSYDVAITSSFNDFGQPFVPHSDGTPTEHGFVSMVPLSDSSFYAVWLDGRNTMTGHNHDHNDKVVSDLSNAMTLRGAFINDSKEIIEQEIDPSLCDCCNTSLVKTSSGLMVAYRDRTGDEVRDIYTSSYSFDLGQWNSPKLVHNDNWQIAACPVNGPMMDSNGSDVVLAWFTGANDQPKVKVSFYSSENENFETPITLDENVPLGRVDVVINDDGSAWVSWMTRNHESAELKLALVSKEDGILKDYSLTKISSSRSAGFPQLTKLGNELMIAWTDISIEPYRIRTLIIR